MIDVRLVSRKGILYKSRQIRVSLEFEIKMKEVIKTTGDTTVTMKECKVIHESYFDRFINDHSSVMIIICYYFEFSLHIRE